jgi:hypothetical protein
MLTPANEPERAASPHTAGVIDEVGSVDDVTINLIDTVRARTHRPLRHF